MNRKFYFILAVTTAAFCSMASAQQTAKVTASGIGYLEYLPKDYRSNSEKYPLVISLHGVKEKGTTSTDRNKVLADLAKVDNVGLPKYVSAGQQYPFILISPQLKSNYGSWPPSYILEVLEYVKKYLRVDDRRVYLTGLSLGGFGVWKTAGEYPQVFAAIAPICPGGNALNKARDIAAQDVAIWGFHGGSDKIVAYTVTTKMINAVNGAPHKPTPLAKATIFPGMGHSIWDKAYNQTGLLNWMLGFRKGSAPPRTQPDAPAEKPKPEKNTPEKKNSRKNSLPVVNAGPDRVLTLPHNSVSIRGQASDRDGRIVAYQWEKTYGRRVSFSGATSPQVQLSNLEAGVYIFRLRAKDNDGGVKDDYFKVTVLKPAGPVKETKRPATPGKNNMLPLVSAGPDRLLTLPENSIWIQSSAEDKDGKIVRYHWTKTYGGKAYIGNAYGPRVKLFNLHEGVYVFRLRVEDNDGGIRDDYMKVTVKAAR